MSSPLLIIGASARSAAFSALRAGLEPWCADLFADADLAGRCSVIRVPGDQYPQAFREILEREPLAPWMYTGAMENHRLLVSQLARTRPLWGNDEEALNPCRLPELWTQYLQDAGIPCPRIRFTTEDIDFRPWLVKPVKSAGGVGIRFWKGEPLRQLADRPAYLQEYVEGEPCAAIYLGQQRQARLLGVTRQLVGESWLHSGRFRYCGSIGPLLLDGPLRRHFEKLGQALAAGCGIRGLFGVDCVLEHGVPWPVEINPRYTSSVEVLEYATGLPALAMHRSVFDPGWEIEEPGLRARIRPAWEMTPENWQGPFVGKAILFAPRDLVFPAKGPWLAALGIRDPWKMPPFADIPAAGTEIRKGHPILTILVQAGSLDDAAGLLLQSATELDRMLFG